MRSHYDFTEGTPNPYAARLKRQITIRLDQSVLDYFKSLSEDAEIPYQTLINLYLRDCAAKKRRVDVRWTRSAKDAG
ncbi:BrnA antitoxin family protein [Myxococcota bacterium]|nr:BrnA antitoxin family protein [Myxococcota bacterium]